ncbi:MAG: hypothetical protein U5K31_01655 [Balneolaceae bacterium]|nr:hypothetical protein [Balneolaceae bacterium]
MKVRRYLLLFFLTLFSMPLLAQDGNVISETSYNGLQLRNIGPALNTARIADIAIHPENENTWYVAVGSGNVWKTVNAGTTFEPIFDNQGSYSTGAVALDPSNPSTVWVGTGENVGGRHVGYGDGIYRSDDGGRSWENMGLENSEHISKIIVHPENSDIVWVAAQGPLWNSGDQRGLYKTTDGGETWTKTLGNDEWTGATDIVIDPRNPDVLYAATWDRHRTTAAYLGGGPGSGVHKSTDGGETWTELRGGLPGGPLGKIGLAISPQDPDRVYAAIETIRTDGGVWMSTDRGASWEYMSDAVSGGTGPHYYQELYASPHNFGELYLVSSTTMMSTDHGANFEYIDNGSKHVDDHAIAFKKSDPDYILFGTDGGLYETYDKMETWRHLDNMPVMQYYKISVDNAKPFYNVYGGTQDNGSNGGPTRTMNSDGITNGDWFKILGADGHDNATEPGNPDIVYASTQQGGLHRIDRTTGEEVYVRPQPGEGEDFERYNWDAPVEVSPHSPTTIYHASHRVWRSENRGNSWTPISGDLTRNEERITLPIRGKQQSWDNAWDVGAMTNYNTITSVAESPLEQGLLYAGTDDGLFHVSENAGESWRRVELGDVEGVPDRIFVNDIVADRHDPNTVYVMGDDHKSGDFSPYLLKSTDRGETWTRIDGDLPDRHLVWRMTQDHVDPDLLFAATEFGIFFTVDGGENWQELSGGVPTIAFRDIHIQREWNDLVAGSFGRGIFILDDYTPLREMTPEMLNSEAVLFDTRDALWYVPNNAIDSEGTAEWSAPNPPYGANLTYYLGESLQSLEGQRKADERALDDDEDVPFVGWDSLEAEMREQGPTVLITIKDENGQVVNRITGPTSEGFHRVNWELDYHSESIIEVGQQAGGFFGGGFRVTPGTYTAELSKVVRGEHTPLSEPITFEVKPLFDGALQRASNEEFASFRETLTQFQRELTRTEESMQEQIDLVNAMQTALRRAPSENPDLAERLNDTRLELLQLNEEFDGSEAKGEIGERNPPTPSDRMFVGYRALFTTYGPTEMHKQTVQVGMRELADIRERIQNYADNVIPELRQAVEATGAPPIEDF